MVRQVKQVISGSSLLFAAMMLVNALNYGYALVLGRFFGPVEYGAYASFISLFLLISLLPMTLQQVTARYSAAKESVVGYTGRLAVITGLILGLSLALASKPLASIIHLPASWLIGLGLMLPLYALIGVARGEAQGEQAFSPLGINLVLEHAGKIALTPLSLFFIPGASGAVLATLAAVPATFAQIKSYLRTTLISKLRKREVRQYALPTFIGLCAQAVIINSDVLMVNALLPAQDAGIYAAIALIGRIVFYGSWAISAAVFPMVAARYKEKKPHLNLLLMALAGVGLVCFGITAICALAPGLVIGLLFGEAYLSGIHLVAPYALMTSLYALANVISNHYLALNCHKAGYLPLAGAALQIALIFLFHESTTQVIWSQMFAKGGLLVTLTLAALFGWLKPKHV